MSTAICSDNILDFGLDYYISNCDKIYLCNQRPSTYAEVATYALGYKSSPTMNGPSARTGGGRRATFSAITDGTSSASGMATYWAALYTGNTELLVVQAMAYPISVISAKDWIISDAVYLDMPGVKTSTALLSDNILDYGLDYYVDNCDEIHLCSQKPTSYADVSTYTLGNKSSPTINGPAARPSNGRLAYSSAITDGTSTDDGTATYYAAVYTGNSELLYTEALDTSYLVISGVNWNLNICYLNMPGPL